MIISSYYNDKNEVLILSAIGKQSRTKTQNNIEIIYNENDQVIGVNHFEKKELKPGIVSFDKLDENITSIFEVETAPSFVFGKVLEMQPHPDAEKLNLCSVDIGTEVLSIVCGAPNCEANKMVVVAKVGTVMPNGINIIPSKVRGIESFGMLCSLNELGYNNDANGIIILEPNHINIGTCFSKERL